VGPSVDDGDIGDAVSGGIVILTGEVNSYAQKWNAARAIERGFEGKEAWPTRYMSAPVTSTTTPTSLQRRRPLHGTHFCPPKR
jgi:hypothetical protein